MPSSCDRTKKVLNDMHEENENTNDIIEQEHSKLFNFTIAPIANFFKGKKIWGSFITDDEFKAAVKDIYGKDDDRSYIAAKIMAILGSNHLLTDMTMELLLERMPDEVQVKFEKGKIDMNKLPLGTLKQVYQQLIKWTTASSGANFGKGVVGKFLVQFHSPKTLALKEKTGGYALMADTITRYAETIASNINEFMHSPKLLKTSRKKGMGDVYRNVQSLGNYFEGDGTKKNETKALRLFQMLMSGWAYIDEETGDIMVYSNYAPVTEGEDWFTYDETGDFKFSFQDPVKLKDYAPPRGKKGDWFLDFDSIQDKKLRKEARKTLKDSLDSARQIDDEVFDYISDEKNGFAASVNELVTELKEIHPGMSEEDIKTIYFRPDTKKGKSLIELMSSEEYGLYKMLQDTFEGYALLEPLMFGGTEIKKRKNHFPVIYSQAMFPFMWDKMIEEFTIEKGRLEGLLEGLTGEDRQNLKTKISNIEFKTARAKNIRGRMDGYHVDLTQDLAIPLAKDVRYSKHISNAFDIRNMRIDSGVYYSYLKHIMASSQRNILTAKMIKSLRTAKSDAVRKTILNLYKTPFNRPDTQGAFGPFTYSSDGVVRVLRAIPGGKKIFANVSPEIMNQHLRTIASFMTGRYLHRWSTSIQNIGAINQAYIDYGFARVREAQDYYKKYKPELKEFIRRTGIIEFQDFFSQALVNDLANEEIEADAADAILGAMIQYYSERKKGVKASVAQARLEKFVDQALQESNAFGQAVIFDENVTEAQLKTRRKTLKRRMRQAAVNKMVNWAINKEYDMKDKVKGWKKVVDLIGLRTAFKAFADVQQSIGLTMGNTESYIRTVSFLIGILRAQEAGYIPQGPVWKLTGKDLQNAIEIGRLSSRFTNFGLSTQDVGQFNWGSVGNLMGKFTYWAQQKWGRDTRQLRDAYFSVKDIKHIEGDAFDPKAIGRLMKMLMTTPPSQLRKGGMQAPQQLRSFLLMQGLATILIDVFILGPIKIPGLTALMYRLPGGKALKGVSSDMLSLMFMPLTISLKFAMWDSGDEEEIERTITYYLRRTTLGYLPMWGWDFLMAMYHGLLSNEEAAIEKGTSIISPVLPGAEATRLVQNVAKRTFS